MTNYLSAADVIDAGAGGRLSLIFGLLTTSAQDSYLNDVTAEVDAITCQSGGLLTQTGKIYQEPVDQYTDTIHLPNSPITAVSAIHVEPPQNGNPWDLICSDGVTIRRTGGSSFRYVYDPGQTPSYVQPQSSPYPFWPDLTVTVTYDCGYVEVPFDVKMAAALLLAARLMQFQDNPGGAEESRQDQAMVIYGRTVVGNIGIIEATRLLEPYKVLQL